MDDNPRPTPFWQWLRFEIKLRLAQLLMRIASPEFLYCGNPQAWDAYMGNGNNPRLVTAFEQAIEAIRNWNGGDELADELEWDSGLYDEDDE